MFKPYIYVHYLKKEIAININILVIIFFFPLIRKVKCDVFLFPDIPPSWPINCPWRMFTLCLRPFIN